jgi:histidinol-phosphate aminotransferase
VGPGNSYVTEAKRQVAGFVGIDAPAGPSEILIIADDSAAPALVARELVAQAEHDPEASCVALVTTDTLQAAVLEALASLTPQRADIVGQAIGERGAVLCIDSLSEAWSFASDYAAEHVLLAIRAPRSSLHHLRHAGTVFFGDGASVAFGDYLTGANHVLPTAGAGRGFSGLSTQDFVRFTTFQEVSIEAAAKMAEDAAVLADAEGLPGHAAAARAYAAPPRAGDVAPGHAARAQPRIELAQLPSYRGSSGPIAVDLSDNTNQRGAPPSARAVMAETSTELMARYPSPDAVELKRAIAERFGVGIDEIVTGCGSDDVIECTLRAFAVPGDRFAFSTPTFSMIPYFATTIGLSPIAIPLLPRARGYDAAIDAMLDSRPAIIYLCSPNNPTGTLVSSAAIERVLAEAPNLVILDEAYVDYGGESWTRRAGAHGNLLVMRTLSKAYGLAGQRVGFAIGAPDLMRAVERVRGPYKVNAIGERAATLALRHDGAWVTDGVREVVDARQRFSAWLTKLGLSPVPSEASFVLVPVRDAAGRAGALRQRGVAVRAFADLPGFGDCLRISVGPWDVMEQALPAFKEVLTCA